jgi:hypothetical protein
VGHDFRVIVSICIPHPSGVQSFGGSYRGRVYVYVFLEVSVCCEHLHCTVQF